MLIAIVAGFLGLAPVSGAEDRPNMPLEQFQVLKRDYDSAFQAFHQASTAAKSETEIAKADALHGQNARSFAGGFMALAKKYPSTETAEEARIWTASHVRFGPETEEAKRLLIRDHIPSARLAPDFEFHRLSCGSQATERLLREAIANNPHRDVRGHAWYWLARYLIEEAQWSCEARRAGGEPTRGDARSNPATMVRPYPVVVEGWGADYGEHQRRAVQGPRGAQACLGSRRQHQAVRLGRGL
jgi:hypothetical protein